jgi:hypothetical protein
MPTPSSVPAQISAATKARLFRGQSQAALANIEPAAT